VYIESLASVGTYLGHECCLFASDVDSPALVKAAKRRWGLHGGFISPKLSKKLNAELGDESIFSTLNQEMRDDPLLPEYASVKIVHEKSEFPEGWS
jgi:hypothetical protein